jgi:tRNA pseudouridine38-40 synthase
LPTTALLLEYNGQKFSGFQKQKNPNLLTVQGELERSIQTVLREPVRIFAAGRTDAGVHAKGMIVHFQSTREISNFYKFNLSINSIIDRDISLLDSLQMSDSFHARFSCTEREYEYFVLASKANRPLLKGKVYWFKKEIDIDTLLFNSKNLVGIHDFASLTTSEAKKNYLSTVRRITSIQIQEDSEIPNLIKFTIRGSGFLHNMIRITIGTLLDISSGKIQKSILEVLKNKDRTQAGITLPPEGLYFKRAYYENFPEIELIYQKNFISN